MIIDHERKYIFVHIPKTGGDSITAALAGTVRSGVVDTYTAKHYTAREILRTHFARRRDAWQEYTRWAIRREPAEMIFSDWRFCKSQLPKITEYRARGLREWSEKLEVVARCDTFAEFVDKFYCGGPLMSHYLTIDGQVVMTNIWRFERLREIWSDICGVIGLGIVPALPHHNGSPAGDMPREVRDLIRQRYAAEYQAWGYD